MADKFVLHSKYKPTGDQPQAIEALVNSVQSVVRLQNRRKKFPQADTPIPVWKPQQLPVRKRV